MKHFATQKVWVGTRNQLVPDGDATAAMLFAREGQGFTTEELAPFSNAADFFDGFSVPAPVAEDEEIELEQEEPRPQKKGKKR